MVILLPDGGRGYLNKVFSDNWMASHGFSSTATGASVGDVLASTGRDFVHLREEATVRDAVALVTERRLARVPVTSAEPPVVMGEVVGSVGEFQLTEALTTGYVQLDDPVTKVIGEPIRLVGAGRPIDDLVELFVQVDTVMVTRDGKPLGTLTRRDLLSYHATQNGTTP